MTHAKQSDSGDFRHSDEASEESGLTRRQLLSAGAVSLGALASLRIPADKSGTRAGRVHPAALRSVTGSDLTAAVYFTNSNGKPLAGSPKNLHGQPTGSPVVTIAVQMQHPFVDNQLDSALDFLPVAITKPVDGVSPTLAAYLANRDLLNVSVIIKKPASGTSPVGILQTLELAQAQIVKQTQTFSSSPSLAAIGPTEVVSFVFAELALTAPLASTASVVQWGDG